MKTILSVTALLLGATAYGAEPPKVKGFVSAEEHEALKARVAELEKALKAAPCVCGDSCKCATGSCPGKCPTAAPVPALPNPASALPTTMFIEGRLHARGADGVYYPSGTGAAPTCVGGTCGVPARTFTPAAQSCPTGTCPLPR